MHYAKFAIFLGIAATKHAVLILSNILVASVGYKPNAPKGIEKQKDNGQTKFQRKKLLTIEMLALVIFYLYNKYKK